ncbi:MAG TPA: thymidylate kinase [Planctomycetia bacterium]|jgi:dTMP kinase|nr:thymidylate kinase [Planctomycetia bacterium]
MNETLPDGAADEPAYRNPSDRAVSEIFGSAPVEIANLPGRLIVLEGTDGAGRSTHVALLREHLEIRGLAVMSTGLTRGRLAGDGLKKAKLGTTAGQRTLDLYYATDFADRLENEILPALRAGFIVLTDRYIYSLMARSAVRGTDRRWLQDLYRFAPIPHGILYLKVDVAHLVPRIVARGGFDYWESGMDFQEETDVFQSFVRYQTRLLAVLDTMAAEFGFQTIDANGETARTFGEVRGAVDRLVDDMRGIDR